MLLDKKLKITIHLRNLGIVAVWYMGATTASEPFHPNSLMLMRGYEVSITAEQLGCPQNKFYLLANKDLLLLAVVKINVS